MRKCVCEKKISMRNCVCGKETSMRKMYDKKPAALLALVLFIAVFSVILAGCGSSNGSATPGHKTGSQGTSVDDILAQEKKKEDDAKGNTTPTSAPTPAEPTGSANPAEPTGSATPAVGDVTPAEPTGSANPGDLSVDLDLTTMSSTLVYSEVYNMMCVPEEYQGCTIKMKGPFEVYVDEATGKYYYACIIQDATACCAQGLEFEPVDLKVYPDDFPEIGTEICVVGEFDTYMEGEYMYCTLRNAKLLAE